MILLLVKSALSDNIVSIRVGGLSIMRRAGECHSCFIKEFIEKEREREREREREAEKKITTQNVAVCE